MERLNRFPGGERVADLLLWLVITAPLLLPDEKESPAGLPLWWVKVAAVPLLGLAVLTSRRQPAVAAAVPAALGLAVAPEMHTSTLAVAQVVLAYLLGRRVPERRSALWLFAAVGALGGLLLLVTPGADVEDGRTLLGTILLVLVLPWLAGQFMGQRAELIRTGWQLAERLEQEQLLIGERVRLRERARIAQDMHDSLGHDLALIAVRAAVLQVADDVGPQGRQAAGELRQAAAEATKRLREVIGVLREEGEGTPLRPAGESVAALVQRAAASGVPVTLDDQLEPPDGDGPTVVLPPMTDRAIHRVVQEALTNATRHAPGAPVAVTLRRDGGQVVVTVTNQVRPGGPSPGPTDGPPGRGGYGLIGLDERVRQAGGTLRTRIADGVFIVTARLPLTAGAPATPPGEISTRREHALARRTARRKMIHTIWLPTAAVAVLLLLMILNDRGAVRSTVLDEEVYRQLRVGDRQSSVEPRLPEDQVRPERDPPGTEVCRFYRTSVDDPSSAYRLCFTDGRLSRKDVVRLDE